MTGQWCQFLHICKLPAGYLLTTLLPIAMGLLVCVLMFFQESRMNGMSAIRVFETVFNKLLRQGQN